MKKHHRIYLNILTVVSIFLLTHGYVYARTEVSGKQVGKWSLSNSPYIVTRNIFVPDKERLIIEAGVVVKFEKGTSMEVKGKLEAKGIQSKSIYFTSIKDDSAGGDSNGDGGLSKPSPGDWGRLYFDNADIGTLLEYCVIRYAGKGSWVDGNIEISGGTSSGTNVVLKNCTIEFSATDGVAIFSASPALIGCIVSQNKEAGVSADSSSAPKIQKCVLSKNSTYGLMLDANAVHQIESATLTDSTFHGILVQGSTVKSATWKHHGVPYVVERNLSVPDGEVLTLEQGCQLKFGEGQSVTVKGKLKAQGTTDQPIVFTSIKDDSAGGDSNGDGGLSKPSPGDWGRLYFDNADIGTLLEYCVIRYAGKGSWVDGNIEIASSDILLKNCTIEFSATNGVYIDNSSPVLRGNKITDNRQIGVSIRSGNPNIGSKSDYGLNIIENNGSFALSNKTSNEILAIGNYWGATNAAKIDAMIEDDNESNRYGIVRFEPFLTTPPRKISITSVSPNSGGVAGGTVITITGKNFVNGATVAIGGKPATDVKVISSTKITAKTPPGDIGSADVTVTNPDGKSATVPDGFVYTEAVKLYPPWDVNQDGIVDIFDLVLVGTHFGEDYREQAPIADSIGKPRSLFYEGNVWLEPTLEMGNSDILFVEVKMTEINDLYGYQFDIAFDSTALEVVEVSPSSLLSQDGAQTYWRISSIDNTHGRILGATHARQAVKKGISGAGTLATVTFRVRDIEQAEQSLIRLGSIKLADSAARWIPIHFDEKGTSLRQIFIPPVSSLLQNYPNPFNPETWIPFKLAQDASVVIRIYSPQGKMVRALNLGELQAGNYVTRGKAAYWNGRDNAGQKVASGLYFYSLKAGKFKATRRMLVIK